MSTRAREELEWAKRLILGAEANVARQRTVVAALRAEGRLSKPAEGLLEQCEQLLTVQKTYLHRLETRGGKSLKDLRDEIDLKIAHPNRRRSDLR